MSSESEIPVTPSLGGEGSAAAGSAGIPGNWKEALACLVSSRIAIIQAESKQAAGSGARKAVLLFISAFCLISTWILVLAGAVGAISANSSWEWYHVTFAASGIHLLIAFVALLVVKSKGTPAFPITRAEFEKDREWLNQLKKQSK